MSSEIQHFQAMITAPSTYSDFAAKTVSSSVQIARLRLVTAAATDSLNSLRAGKSRSSERTSLWPAPERWAICSGFSCFTSRRSSSLSQIRTLDCMRRHEGERDISLRILSDIAERRLSNWGAVLTQPSQQSWLRQICYPANTAL
jgi:hypothetical protein